MQAKHARKLIHNLGIVLIVYGTLVTAYLVIIGASGTAGRLSGLLMGNVTRQIVEHALCAVLVASQTLQNSIPAKHNEHSNA
jgi:nucleotide-binding universal stress UspA family protein